jgi:hypothetical protein
MQKFLVITAFVLLSSISAAAQTGEEKKPVLESGQVEFARRPVNARPGLSAPAKTGAERRQTERVVDGRVVRVGPTTTYLKNGLRIDEVVRLLGKPTSVSERLEGNRLLSTYTFSRSEGRVFVAEFENGVLFDSRLEPASSLK